MNHKQILSNNFLAQTSLLQPQPLPAWIAILGLVFVTALCIFAGAGSLLRVAFPVGSFAVGLFLYLRYPVIYVSFTWWLWFLTPWLRRVIDYRSGWDSQGTILLSPFLVTLITFITFLQYFPKAYRQGGLPFTLAIVSVTYSFLIGIVKTSFITAARAYLDWLTPILFGFHLLMNWRDYQKLRQNIQYTFLWGVLVMGFYGVYQYLKAPEWDCFWMIKTGLSTNGTPEPLGIRVFSTMNSPAPFAVTMMAGLLLLFSSQNSSPLRIFAATSGYLAFLLSAVRAAWGGWLIGCLALAASLKARFQVRLIVSILVMALCIFPLVSIKPFSDVIFSRLQSFSDIKNDQSANDRTKIYEKSLSTSLSNILGSGIGNTLTITSSGKLEAVVIDSGIIDMFSTLGWFGSIPYLTGILMLLSGFLQSSKGRLDSFLGAARAISLGIFMQMPFFTATISLSGVVFWAFSGMTLAGYKYYYHQHTAALKKG